jgi:hypothetical protein
LDHSYAETRRFDEMGCLVNMEMNESQDQSEKRKRQNRTAQRRFSEQK